MLFCVFILSTKRDQELIVATATTWYVTINLSMPKNIWQVQFAENIKIMNKIELLYNLDSEP